MMREVVSFWKDVLFIEKHMSVLGEPEEDNEEKEENDDENDEDSEDDEEEMLFGHYRIQKKTYVRDLF